MPKSKDGNKSTKVLPSINWGAIQFLLVSLAFFAIGISSVLIGTYLTGIVCLTIAAFYLVLGTVKLLSKQS